MTDHWKIVLRSTFPQDIYLARAYLESEGIETMLNDELIVQVHNFYSNAVGGVKLLVHASDFKRAFELLEASGYIVDKCDPQVPIEIIRTKDRTLCPYCGSDNIVKRKDVDGVVLAFYAVLGVFFPVFRPTYICFDCRKNWKFRKP